MEVATRLFVLLLSSAIIAASAAAVSPPTKLEIGSKKILVLLPVASPSHHNLFSSLTNELMERGHDVTIVSSLPQKTKHPRLREIAVKDAFEEFNKMKVDLFKGPGNPLTNIVIMYLIGTLLSTVVLESPEVLALKNEKFDLVITETYFFQEPLLAFAHHFGCPSMTINPFGYSQELNEFTGGATNPAYVPNLYGGGAKLDTFWNRLCNTVNTIASWLSFHLYYYHKCNALMHKAFPDAPPLYDLLNNVSLTLINNNAALMPAVALSPSVIEVGGMQIRPGKPLSADLKKWIEDSKDGIVYFSLGSNLKAHLLSPEKQKAIFASFAKLKQRVLVKWNGEIPAFAPKNCRFETWVPQQEVLIHPKLKVFVTHGGLLSTQESIYYGAPVIGMPVYGDQFMNMERAVQQGFGRMVSIFDVKTEALDDALNEVIYNPKFREQSLKFSARFRADPIPPLEKAVHYTELLMKLGDLKHLQPSSVHLHWYQYLLLDVAAVIILGLYVTWRIIRCLFCACLGCCRKSPKSKKD